MKKETIKELISKYEYLLKFYKDELKEAEDLFKQRKIDTRQYFSSVDSNTSSIVAYEHVIADLKELIKEVG